MVFEHCIFPSYNLRNIGRVHISSVLKPCAKYAPRPWCSSLSIDLVSSVIHLEQLFLSWSILPWRILYEAGQAITMESFMRWQSVLWKPALIYEQCWYTLPDTSALGSVFTFLWACCTQRVYFSEVKNALFHSMMRGRSSNKKRKPLHFERPNRLALKREF